MVSKRLTNALTVFFWEADSCIANDAGDADDSAITAKGAAQTSAPNNNPKHLFLMIILLITSVIQQ